MITIKVINLFTQKTVYYFTGDEAIFPEQPFTNITVEDSHIMITGKRIDFVILVENHEKATEIAECLSSVAYMPRNKNITIVITKTKDEEGKLRTTIERNEA